MKKLAVPFLVLSLAAFGCSSSSSNKDASGGNGGSTGGSSGGTGGTGGTGGRGAGGGGAGGTTSDGGNPDTLQPSCTVVTDTTTADQSMVLTAQVFCDNLQSACAGMLTTPYMGATCTTTYTASTRQHCQSYHLCWGVEGGGAGPASVTPHCSHAQGMGVCAPLDGSAGN